MSRIARLASAVAGYVIARSPTDTLHVGEDTIDGYARRKLAAFADQEPVAVFHADFYTVIVRTAEVWHAYRMDDESGRGEVLSEPGKGIPDSVTPEALPDFLAVIGSVYEQGRIDGVHEGRAQGKSEVERKIQDVGRLIFGDVLEGAIERGVRNLVPSEY